MVTVPCNCGLAEFSSRLRVALLIEHVRQFGGIKIDAFGLRAGCHGHPSVAKIDL
jgi:hypothetical protein